MRGKDFVWKYTQHSFKNKNTGKGIYPTLAIISNPKVRRSMGVAKKRENKQVVAVSNGISDDKLDATDIHTMMEYTCYILLFEDFVKIDEENLFQEVNI